MVYGFFAINHFYIKRFGQTAKMYKCYANIKVIIANAIVFVLAFLLKQQFYLSNYFLIGIYCLFASLIYIYLIYVFKIFNQDDLHVLFGR